MKKNMYREIKRTSRRKVIPYVIMGSPIKIV